MSWLYSLTIYPLELVYKYIYTFCASLTGSYGIGLVALSVCTVVIFTPLKRMASSAQNKEWELQDILQPQIQKISSECSGAERHERIAKLYRRYGYHPVMAIRSAFGVALQVPFLMAAYYMISGLTALQGHSFLFIKDLSQPDGLLSGVNLLPIVMTLVNFAAAFTSKDMRCKDRLQAMVVALLFLWLLYGAPSALLFYWTCNNVIYLGQNFIDIVNSRHSSKLEEYKIFIDDKMFNSNFLREMISDNRGLKERFGLIIFPSFFCTFMLLFFGPLDLCHSNGQYLPFSVLDIICPVTVTTAICLVLISMFALLLRGVVLDVFINIVFVIGLSSWIQGNFLNLNLGALDGSVIPWHNYLGYALFGLVLWISIYVVFRMLCLFNKGLWRKILKSLSIWLILVQSAMLIITIKPSNFIIKNDTDSANLKYYLSDEYEYTLSKNKNIVVFVLDSLSFKMMPSVFKRYPEIKKIFSDFTYYNNCNGIIRGTFYAIPYLLTGYDYDTNRSYVDYLNEAFSSDLSVQFYKAMHANGYKCMAYVNLEYVSTDGKNMVGKIDNLSMSQKELLLKPLLINMIKLSLYRYSPQVLKPLFWLSTSDFADVVTYNKGKKYSSDNLQFYQSLQKRKLSVNDSEGIYMFYHLRGLHAPQTINENVEFAVSPNAYQVVRGCFRIIEEYIRQMRLLGIYDNSSIIITADHGNGVYPAPILFVKKAGERHEYMLESSAPVSLHDYLPTIIRLADIEDVSGKKSIFDYKDGENREREMRLWAKDLNYPLLFNANGSEKNYNVIKSFKYTTSVEKLVLDKTEYHVLPLYDCFYK